MVTAKGITSGYVPLGAVLVTADDRRASSTAGPTASRSATPTPATRPRCAVAMANLDLIEGEGLVERAGALGDADARAAWRRSRTCRWSARCAASG